MRDCSDYYRFTIAACGKLLATSRKCSVLVGQIIGIGNLYFDFDILLLALLFLFQTNLLLGLRLVTVLYCGWKITVIVEILSACGVSHRTGITSVHPSVFTTHHAPRAGQTGSPG